jgi:2'-5' RNA ligase
MIVLHGQIERPLQKLGFRSEHRRYHSHLTLGRVRSGGPNMAGLAELLQTHADYEAGRLKVTQVVVFSSLLGPGGPTYEALSRAKLSGG